MKREMTGAEMVVQALKDEGVDKFSDIPGAPCCTIYDEIYKHHEIRHILVRHEQAGPMPPRATPAHLQTRRRPRHLGPRRDHAVTGPAYALMDSIPMVVISGQVPAFMIGNDAFQEADIVGITRPCTKHN